LHRRPGTDPSAWIPALARPVTPAPVKPSAPAQPVPKHPPRPAPARYPRLALAPPGTRPGPAAAPAPPRSPRLALALAALARPAGRPRTASAPPDPRSARSPPGYPQPSPRPAGHLQTQPSHMERVFDYLLLWWHGSLCSARLARWGASA